VASTGVRLLCCGDGFAAARRLRDTGHEVVLLDAGVSAEQLATVAVQEDVEVVAVTDAEVGAAAAGPLGESVVVFWVTSESAPS
jgi:hypothetical protein